MNKEEIKALLAIINRQCFIGVSMEAIQNNLEYRLLRSAATKLERMLLDIESRYNNFRWYIQPTNSELLHTPQHVTQYPAACHPETAKSGRQTELPPTGGQQAYVAQNAEKAKQETLLCTGAEQLETRKGN